MIKFIGHWLAHSKMVPNKKNEVILFDLKIQP